MCVKKYNNEWFTSAPAVQNLLINSMNNWVFSRSCWNMTIVHSWSCFIPFFTLIIWCKTRRLCLIGSYKVSKNSLKDQPWMNELSLNPFWVLLNPPPLCPNTWVWAWGENTCIWIWGDIAFFWAILFLKLSKLILRSGCFVFIAFWINWAGFLGNCGFWCFGVSSGLKSLKCFDTRFL